MHPQSTTTSTTQARDVFMMSSGLTLLFSRTVGHDFFHELDIIFGFLFCPELSGSWGAQHPESGKTTPEESPVPPSVLSVPSVVKILCDCMQRFLGDIVSNSEIRSMP
jgi:hypothetical protein